MEKECAFECWNENHHLFPILSHVARRFLSAPATSVASECLFSIYTHRRSALKPERAEMLTANKRKLETAQISIYQMTLCSVVWPTRHIPLYTVIIKLVLYKLQSTTVTYLKHPETDSSNRNVNNNKHGGNYENMTGNSICKHLVHHLL